MCRREAEQKLCHFAVNAARVSEGAEFRVYDQILDKMDTFKYPGQMLSFDEIYWTVVVRNLHRAQSKLGMFSYLLGWEGGDISTSERFYVVVVHFFLISGSDSWVMLTHIMWELGSLHNQVARKISGQIPW